MKKKATNQFHINPKFRAYGKARLDIAQRASSEEEWDRLWKNSAHPFPFAWNGQWKQCIEYKVDDFAAEVGFLIDILGLPINALDPDYAMFTSPAGDFYFSVVPAAEGEPSTPPDAIRIQFMIADIQETALELERRGIPFELWPQVCAEGSSLFIGYFRTPHGICVDLWGTVEKDEEEAGEQTSDLDENESEAALTSSEQSLPAEFDGEDDLLILGQVEFDDQPDQTSGTGEEAHPVEAIPFSHFDLPGDSNSQGSTEEDFPSGNGEQEDEVVELEYEYIDDDV